jgi:hypothetical protein
MSGPTFTVTLLIEFICGAAGGLAVAHWLPQFSFGAAVNALAGGAGGILFTWLAAGIPGVGRFVGYVEHAASATVQGVGGLTPAILVGSGIAGLLGGLALTFIGGLVRNAAVD